MVIELRPQPGFKINDDQEVSPIITKTTDANGAWSASLEENDNITPAGSYYVVKEKVPVHLGGVRQHVIEVISTGGSVIDLRKVFT